MLEVKRTNFKVQGSSPVYLQHSQGSLLVFIIALDNISLLRPLIDDLYRTNENLELHDSPTKSTPFGVWRAEKLVLFTPTAREFELLSWPSAAAGRLDRCC